MIFRKVIVKNTGDIPEMVLRHSVPVGRASSILIQDTLSGTSEIRFRIATGHPAFISLQDVSNPGIILHFPVCRGESYRLDFDGSAFSFEEPGQDAQVLYAAIPVYGHPQMEARSYTGDTDPVLIRARIDSVRALQMAPFDSLLKARGISPEMYDLIAADRECNALSVMAQAGILLRSEEIQEAALESFNPDSDRMLGAPAYFDLMEAYASRKLMQRRDMVEHYRLRGHHVRAGEALVSDLRHLFDAGGTMAIPWNMIVDVRGHIVQLHAPRPSDTEALSAALDSVE